ncbi:MAG: Ig-like domain-containing protein [Gammaproteobacteria bacterium]|nr:Ig-like domain-containing protein [Gammaproteobacteria bacterium]
MKAFRMAALLSFLFLSTLLTSCGSGEKADQITSITIEKEDGYLEIGTFVSLKLVGKHDNGSSAIVTEGIKWSVDNEAIARVNETGELLGVDLGTVKVTATLGDLSDSISVTTKIPQSELKISLPEGAIVVDGGTVKLLPKMEHGLTSAPQIDGEIFWSSSDPTLATVDTAGNVALIAPGKVTITAKYEHYQASITFTIGVGVESLQMQASKEQVLAEEEISFTVFAKNRDGSSTDVTDQVQWSVFGNGLERRLENVFIAGPGATTVTVKATYLNASVSYEVKIQNLLRLYVANDYDSTISLHWPNTGAQSYNIYWADQSGVDISSTKKSGLTTTQSSFTGLVPGEDYFFRIAQVRDGVESELSEELKVQLRKNQWKDSIFLESPREGMAVAKLGSLLHLIGGADHEFLYDWNEAIDLDTWSAGEKTAAPYFGRGMATCSDDETVFTFGGLVLDVDNKVVASANSYSSVSNTWTSYPDMQKPRLGAVCAISGNNVYVFGGIDDQVNFVNSIEVLNLSAGIWLSEFEPATPYADMTTSRVEATATVYNGKIYLFGGVENSVLSSVAIYDIATNSWGSATSIPTPRSNMTMIRSGNKVTLMGGYDGNDSAVLNFTTRVDQFDLETDTWKPLSPMPFGRADFGAIEHKGNIYLFGGHYQQQIMSEISYYNIAENRWFPRKIRPQLLAFSSTAVIGDSIYMIGGDTGTSDQTGAVTRYETTTDTWHSVAPMNKQRMLAGAATIDEKIYVVGGYDTFGEISNVEVFDKTTGLWTALAPLPTKRGALRLEAVAGKLYAIGGTGDPKRVDEYDPQTDTWLRKSDLPGSRAGATSVVLNNRIYLIGGTDRDSEYKTVFQYNPTTDHWSSVASTREERYLSDSIVINGRIYVFGGVIGQQVLDSVEVFDPLKNQWQYAADMPIPRHAVLSEFVGNTAYIFGGYTSENLPRRSMNLFE